MPLSGAAGGDYQGDIKLQLGSDNLVIEVKHHADGFKQSYGWLEGRDMLITKADRKEPLLTMRLADAIRLYNKGKTCP